MVEGNIGDPMDPWHFVRQCGPWAVAAGGVGIVAGFLGVAALILVPFAETFAYRLGLLTVLLALGAVSMGWFGVGAMDRENKQGLASFDFGEMWKERARRELEPWVKGSATVGYTVAGPPLFLGGLAALLAARRKRGERV